MKLNTTDMKKISNLIKISLNLSNFVDERCGKNGINDPCLKVLTDELGLGPRALSSYLRDGVQDIIQLEKCYYWMQEMKEYAEMSEKELRDYIEELFGDREPHTICGEYQKKIHDFMEVLLAEMDQEAEEEKDE